MYEGFIGVVSVVALYMLQALFAAFVLLRPRSRQASSMAWLLLIVGVPLVGIVLYLIVGEVRFGRTRIQRHAAIVSRVRAAVAEAWSDSRPSVVEEPYDRLGMLAGIVGDTAPRGGNLLTLIAETDEVIVSLIDDIDSARDHVHLLFYIFVDDSSGKAVGEALLRAAKRGVRCRLLVDAVGSSRFLKSELHRRLGVGGIHVVAALPTPFTAMAQARIDLRNHRKIAIVDGRVGYTGSHNLADAFYIVKPRYAPWVDATVRIDGPAVRDLQTLFVQDWFMDTDEELEDLLEIDLEENPGGKPVQIIGTGINARNEALVQLMQAAIQMARDELIITTPYFVPDEGTTDALETAALRGVRTVLVVPARNDSFLVGLASRSFYEPLLDAGVEIHEFTKGLLHAKTMTVDRDLALISTANVDRRSFEINFEVSVLVYDTDFASELRFLQRSYLDDARKIDGAAWSGRAWPRRLAHNAAGMFSPLL